MIDPHQLAALAAVVEAKGFDAAAAQLAITQSAVSQRVRALETRLGLPLLTRTRPPRVTPMGQAVLRHWRQAQLLDQALMASIGQMTGQEDGAQPKRRVLAIAVNNDSLATWIAGALAAFAQTHLVDLRMYVDDQDHTQSLMRDGTVMACVTTAGRALQGASATLLGPVAYRCTAAPGFVKQWFPRGLQARDVLRAPAVIFDEKDDMHADFLRQVTGLKSPTFPYHRVPSSSGFMEAIRHGWGYGMVPENQVAALLQSGEIVDLAPRRALHVTLYWHRWRIADPMLEAAGDALAKAAATSFRY
jgi:LysR family transcriptional regulator, chromosome initiation inhibitor